MPHARPVIMLAAIPALRGMNSCAITTFPGCGSIMMNAPAARRAIMGIPCCERPRSIGHGASRKDHTMKYMIMMFGGLGATLQNRTPEWITGMHELMMKLDTELKEAGEVVASQGLVDPSQAKTVRFHNGASVPTDGPFAEIKESLAGYWIVDVDEERAIDIASQVVAYTEYPMEVRRVMHGDDGSQQ